MHERANSAIARFLLHLHHKIYWVSLPPSMTRFRLFSCFCAVLLMIGCTEFPDCQDPRAPFLRASFNVKTTGAPVLISFDEVKAVGASAPIYRGDTLNTFNLHLNPQDTVTTFLFTTNGFNNNLTVAYKSKLILITPECGPVQYFYDLRLVSSSFDSVVVQSREVDLNKPVNVQIFL